jgi:two-component system, LytTR family, sensor kinase
MQLQLNVQYMAIKSENRWVEIAKFFFIGGGLLTLIFPFAGTNLSAAEYLKYGFLNGFAFAIFGYGNSALTDWLDNYLPWTGNVPKRLIAAAIVTFVYTSVTWILVMWIWILVTNGYMMNLAELMKVLLQNKNAFWTTHIITLVVSTFMHGRSFLMEWKKTAIEAEKLKKEQIAAKYEVLRNQVNPHFLFNSLNVLTTLVHKDADLAEKFIKQLSDNYRYVLDTREQEVVALNEEIRNLEAYIFLMKIRFGDSLKAHIQVDSDGKVAPLTLQMLVENAIKHNEVSKSNPLSIDVFEEGDYIIVKNNMQKKNNVVESTGLGLTNIKARYTFLNEKKVIIDENDGCFMVKIPIIL